MKGFDDGERKIQAYLEKLQIFASDPQVSESVINVRRNLLFRSRGFTEPEIARITKQIAEISGRHASNAGVRKWAPDALLVALRSTATDRKLDAVTRYF